MKSSKWATVLLAGCFSLTVAGGAEADSHAHAPVKNQTPPAKAAVAPAADPAAKVAPAPHAVADVAANAKPAMTPDKALAQLVEGNARFVMASQQNPRRDQDRRCDTYTKGQHPVATILSCADSRVPVEMVFDQGIGDLFVIRVAGNVSDTDEIATAEYGAGHLDIPLIVIMGHSKCGAVTAVVDKAQLHGNLAGLLDNIAPAAQAAREKFPSFTGAALVQQAVKTNVMQSIQDMISHSPDISKLVAAGKVKIVGAVYDLHSGTIDWLGEHPNQVALLKAGATPAQGHGKANDKSAGHGKAEMLHDAKTAAHDEHSSATTQPAEPAASVHDKPHNFKMLASMLLGAGLISTAIIHLSYGRKSATKVAAPNVTLPEKSSH